MDDKFYTYQDETALEKLSRKTKDSPFMAIGFFGFFTACAIGAYKFKTRKISASLYFCQLRVIAQGMVVGALTIGVIGSMVNDYVLKKKPEN